MSHLKLSGESPTGVFPWQVWENFLQTLEEIGGDEELDIGLNILNASTELQKIFKKEKASFALKKVIRLLFENKWMDFQDLLTLRLVSKNLTSSIHSFVNETRRVSLFEAYDPEKHGKVMDLRRLRMDKAPFCEPGRNFAGFRLHETVDRDDTDDESNDGVTEFRMDLARQNKAGGFPFTMAKTVPLLVTRSASARLIVYGNGTEFDMIEDEEVDVSEKVSSFLNGVGAVLNLIGSHVWSLDFNCDIYVEEMEVGSATEASLTLWAGFSKLLHKLGNLRHLRIGGSGLEEAWIRDNDLENWVLPTLPYLESIEVAEESESCVNDFLPSLVNHFSAQLRRLSLPDWGYSSSSLSPNQLRNLTEVEILECQHGGGRSRDGTVRKFLDELKAPLVRLKLEFVRDSWEELELLESAALKEEVFHWLKQFPALQSLQVLSGRIYLLETNEAEGPAFPNLRFLQMEDGSGGLTFQFLRRLPLLQYLELTASPLPTVWDDSVDWPGMVKFKKELEEGRLYNSNIWELLPELKSVTVRFAVGKGSPMQFLRERYERLKLGKEKRCRRIKAEDGKEMEDLCHPLRKDIWDYLDMMAKRGIPTHSGFGIGPLSTVKIVCSSSEASGSESDDEDGKGLMADLRELDCKPV